MSEPLARLIGELARLPGIGPKTATRLAHYLLKVPASEAEALAQAIVEVKEKLFHCSVCRAITAVDPCDTCADPRRERARLCVVEEPWNIQPIERTGEYRGLYHVLLGALSPQRGVGPDQLAIEPLLARLLKGRVPHVTRLAFGLPIGGDIEYADEVTLGRSLSGRREMV